MLVLGSHGDGGIKEKRMKRLFLAMSFFLCILLLTFFKPVIAASSDELQAAALRLKEAHVVRSLELCLLYGSSEKRCRQVLQIEHDREIKVFKRLMLGMPDPKIDVDQLNKEVSSCYSPNNTYTHLIDCWQRLADRLDAARKGVTLLKR